MMLMGLCGSVRGGAPLAEIERLCAVAIHTVESWQVESQRSAESHASEDVVPGRDVHSRRRTL